MTRQTLLELITWLDLHAGAVQGGAAIVTVVLILVVIGVAVWAARSAGRQAEQARKQVDAAQRQVQEAIEARRALVRPYVHVDTRVAVSGQIGGGSTELGVDIALRNVGQGPALSVRSRLEHPWLRFTPPRGVPDGMGGTIEVVDPSGAEEAGEFLLEPGDRRHVRFMVAEASTGHDAIEPASVVVEYRDLVDRWWRTTVPIRFGYQRAGEAFTRITAVALDQQERAHPIDGPTVQQDRVRRDGD